MAEIQRISTMTFVKMGLEEHGPEVKGTQGCVCMCLQQEEMGFSSVHFSRSVVSDSL